jgi:hypothetical protein
MPVRKFRSVADMPGARPLPRLQADNLRRAVDLMDLGARLLPLDYDPGVRAFRSFDAALAHRDAREASAAQRTQAQAKRST